MIYKNTEMKIDSFVNYCNEDKINLSPAFQRGHVWTVNDRQKLLKNILNKKPIPAVFLYKEAVGSKYLYNILDGKQRLESIMLFINSSRRDFSIPQWKKYFLQKVHRDQANFRSHVGDETLAFSSLSDEAVREFREYSIPTIEITLDDETTLDEIINLFVDINQQGEPVARFSIIKAIHRDSKLLSKIFKYLALSQKRGKDQIYKVLDKPATQIFKRMRDIRAVQDQNYRVDRMWEKMLEFVLFLRSGIHRKHNEILMNFINSKKITDDTPLSAIEIRKFDRLFTFLLQLSKRLSDKSPMLTEYTHLYSVVTLLLKRDIPQSPEERGQLMNNLQAIDTALFMKGSTKSPALRAHIKLYFDASQRATNSPKNREIRQAELEKMLVQV